MKKIRLLCLSIALCGYTHAASASYYDSAQRIYKDTLNQYKDTMNHLMAPASTEGWTGYYAGINAGYGWGTQSIDQTSNSPTISTAITNLAIPPSLASSPAGLLAGVQIGYNYQLSRTVFGVEADYQTAHIDDKTSFTNTNPSSPAFRTAGRQQLEALATLRARLGFAPTKNLLLYLSGGLAYGHVSLSGSVTSPGCVGFCGNNSNSTGATGWAAGPGVEYSFATDWSAKIEYLYYDLGGQSQQIQNTTTPGTHITQKLNVEGNLVRLGLNYRFM